VNAIQGWIVALALAGSLAPLNLWAQHNEAELIKQAHVTKRQAESRAQSTQLIFSLYPD